MSAPPTLAQLESNGTQVFYKTITLTIQTMFFGELPTTIESTLIA